MRVERRWGGAQADHQTAAALLRRRRGCGDRRGCPDRRRGRRGGGRGLQGTAAQGERQDEETDQPGSGRAGHAGTNGTPDSARGHRHPPLRRTTSRNMTNAAARPQARRAWLAPHTPDTGRKVARSLSGMLLRSQSKQPRRADNGARGGAPRLPLVRGEPSFAQRTTLRSICSHMFVIKVKVCQ